MGLPLFTICYGLLPFPIGIAIFRAIFEADAESYALVRTLSRLPSKPAGGLPHALPINEVEALNRLERFATTVASAAYLWPLPRTWNHSLFYWIFRSHLRRFRS